MLPVFLHCHTSPQISSLNTNITRRILAGIFTFAIPFCIVFFPFLFFFFSFFIFLISFFLLFLLYLLFELMLGITPKKSRLPQGFSPHWDFEHTFSPSTISTTAPSLWQPIQTTGAHPWVSELLWTIILSCLGNQSQSTNPGTNRNKPIIIPDGQESIQWLP